MVWIRRICGFSHQIRKIASVACTFLHVATMLGNDCMLSNGCLSSNRERGCDSQDEGNIIVADEMVMVDYLHDSCLFILIHYWKYS